MEKTQLIYYFRKYSTPIFLLILLIIPGVSFAVPSLDALTVTTGAAGEQKWSITIQALVLMTVITLLPSMLLMMTSFTRIIIVLHQCSPFNSTSELIGS